MGVTTKFELNNPNFNQIMRFQYICREDFIRNIKGKQKKNFFSDFWSYDNIALKEPYPHTLTSSRPFSLL